MISQPNYGLMVEVIDRRLQTDLPYDPNQNQFIEQEQGFQSATQRKADEQDDDDENGSIGIGGLPQPTQPSQRDMLIEQNLKLKTQIYELAKQLDEILHRDKAAKKRKIHEEQDEGVKQKKLELHQLSIQVTEIKNRTFLVKRQLQMVYNNQGLLTRQNLLVELRGALRSLEMERDGLLKVKQTQVKALKTLKNQEEFSQKLNEALNTSARLKHELKSRKQSNLIAQKSLLKLHEVLIGRSEKMKELETKMATNREKAKSRKANNKSMPMSPIQHIYSQQNSTSITDDIIAQLEEQIKQFEEDKHEGEKAWQDKIRAVEDQLTKKRVEEERKLVILREKEKEFKLNELKIRQLRKLVRNNIASEQAASSKDQDMKEFRHKRNIRYLEKSPQ